MPTEDNETLIAFTSDIVAAHLVNNVVPMNDLPTLIQTVYAALNDLGQPTKEAEARPQPAVPIRASVKPDYIICLEDGKKLKMLKRYLATEYNMTPDEYRRRWNLPTDYPMVAPSHSAKRSELAKISGLGRDSGRRRGRRKASPSH